MRRSDPHSGLPSNNSEDRPLSTPWQQDVEVSGPWSGSFQILHLTLANKMKASKGIASKGIISRPFNVSKPHFLLVSSHISRHLLRLTNTCLLYILLLACEHSRKQGLEQTEGITAAGRTEFPWRNTLSVLRLEACQQTNDATLRNTS